MPVMVRDNEDESESWTRAKLLCVTPDRSYPFSVLTDDGYRENFAEARFLYPGE
jgi:hypothetical protein